jgi:DNA-directed RNA polymerase
LNILGKTAWKINKEILKASKYCDDNHIAIGDIPSRTSHELPPEPLRPERIDPEVYADSESLEAQAAIAANKAYREKLFKRQKMHQKNMVSAVGWNWIVYRYPRPLNTLFPIIGSSIFTVLCDAQAQPS